jgi:hypothetical protein
MQQMGDYQQSLDAMFAATLESLEWGANLASGYAFGELPMGEKRLQVLEQLNEQLLAINFSGVVRVETHVADFCLSVDGSDGYRLADNDLQAISCDTIGVAPGEAYEIGLGQSVAFANFIRLADERSGGRIRYEIISLGNSDPLMSYPASAEGMTAGSWNRIAAANNRVEISIFAEGF